MRQESGICLHQPARLGARWFSTRPAYGQNRERNTTAVREAAADVRDAVVIGSGFIGMEIAASLTELGLRTG